ncbi:MAG: kelch repeat-containing protein [Polyangiales bacterium]
MRLRTRGWAWGTRGVHDLSRGLRFVAAALLTSCGASVRGVETPRTDAGPADASLGPIPGCPARSGAPRGRWEPLALPDGFTARVRASLVAADRSLVILGGSGDIAVSTDNWRFDPREGRWTPLGPAGLAADSRYVATVWMPDAREVFTWRNLERQGARVTLDGVVRPLPTEGAPRTWVQRAVWVAGHVFVGGSTAEGDHDEFVLYDPRADRWETVLAPREQTSRGSYAMVANEREVVVWGGSDATTGTGPPRADGWRFDVPTRRWSSVSQVGAPAARWGHGGWWVDDAVLVWGGNDGSRVVRAGGLYRAIPDAWRPTTAVGAPGPPEGTGSFEHAAVWTGGDLYAWTLTSSGDASAGRYDPRVDRWFPADPPPRATVRRESSSAWVDCALYVVGGRDGQRGDFTREVVRWVP